MSKDRELKLKELRRRIVVSRAGTDRTMAMLQAHRDDIDKARKAVNKLCRRKNASMANLLTQLCITIVSSQLTDHFAEKMLLEEQISGLGDTHGTT